eukprot:SAG11_NODE_1693_length_4437_cov_46.960120_2_plen_88_part_00
MRIIDNSTYDDDAAHNIALKMQEMIGGAGCSKSKAWSAFLRLARRRAHVECSHRYAKFYQTHWRAVELHVSAAVDGRFNTLPGDGTG